MIVMIYIGSAVKVNSTDLLTACHVVFDERIQIFRKYICKQC